MSTSRSSVGSIAGTIENSRRKAGDRSSRRGSNVTIDDGSNGTGTCDGGSGKDGVGISEAKIDRSESLDAGEETGDCY